jgi:hypothetical protein
MSYGYYGLPSIETMDKREFVKLVVYLHHVTHEIVRNEGGVVMEAFLRNLLKTMIYVVNAIDEFAKLVNRPIERVKKNIEESVEIMRRVVEEEILRSPMDFLENAIPELRYIVDTYVDPKKYFVYHREAVDAIEAIMWLTGVLWRIIARKAGISEEEARKAYLEGGEKMIQLRKKLPGVGYLISSSRHSYFKLMKQFYDELWMKWFSLWANEML